MDESYKKLNYYQVMAFLYEVEQLKKNKEFNDSMVDVFYYVFMKRLKENLIKYQSVPEIVFKNLKIYSFSLQMYQHMFAVTGLNVEDRELMKVYKKYIKSYENYVFAGSVLNSVRKTNLLKVRRNDKLRR